MRVHKVSAYDIAKYSKYESYQELIDAEDAAVRLDVPVPAPFPLFSLSQYRSGEISAGYSVCAPNQKPSRNLRQGNGGVTYGFRTSSRQKIRRAVENSTQVFRVFMTLTFAPGALHPWHFEDAEIFDFVGPGSADHPRPTRRVVRSDFAKWKLRKLRQAMTMRVNREIDAARCKKEMSPEDYAEYMENYSLRFVWAAELQGNGNLHFHLLMNRPFDIKWLTETWGQASNSVDVEYLKNAVHAANYISKYVSKEEHAPIRGNRYNISRVVRREARPVMKLQRKDEEAIRLKKMLGIISEVIEQNGGRVIAGGFGVIIPRPRKSRPYKDREGNTKRTRAVNPGLHEAFMDAAFSAVPF